MRCSVSDAGVLTRFIAYRDKKEFGVFCAFFRAPLQQSYMKVSPWTGSYLPRIMMGMNDEWETRLYQGTPNQVYPSN
jgi:hypothetical protein